MGPETINKLPVIDFSNLKQESPTWESLKAQVLQALEEYGCFEAIFDQIPLDLQKSTLDAVQQFFDLPLQIKLRNTSDKPYCGFVGKKPSLPLHEGVAIEDALSPGKVESFTNLQWPQGNPTFSKSVQSFSEKLSELDKIVRRMVLESLGLENYIDEHMDSTNCYVVRIMKYDGPQSHEPKLGFKSHSDLNFVTILYQNEVRGLEVQTKDGQWITVEPSSNSFIVLAGESFHAWTNGRLRCPQHRVMMTSDQDRYAIGLFAAAKSGYIIKAPPEMVDKEHPLLYMPFDLLKFLEFYFSEAGRNSRPNVLKAYCGA